LFDGKSILFIKYFKITMVIKQLDQPREASIYINFIITDNLLKAACRWNL